MRLEELLWVMRDTSITKTETPDPQLPKWLVNEVKSLGYTLNQTKLSTNQPINQSLIHLQAHSHTTVTHTFS